MRVAMSFCFFLLALVDRQAGPPRLLPFLPRGPLLSSSAALSEQWQQQQQQQQESLLDAFELLLPAAALRWARSEHQRGTQEERERARNEKKKVKKVNALDTLITPERDKK